MTPARRYFAARAIDPQVAHDVGVRPGRNANELAFPNGRRRVLDSGRVLQAKGQALQAWWVVPAGSWQTALVCEGESDSLSALTALRSSPEAAGLRDLPILCVPGTGLPVDRMVQVMRAWKALSGALLATDPDEAGEKFAAGAAEALLDVGIRPVRVQVPEPDLAGWLSTLPVEDRGERLASLLIDSELAAPTRAELYRHREIEQYKARIAELEAA